MPDATLVVRLTYLVDGNSGGEVHMEEAGSCLRQVGAGNAVWTIPLHIKVCSRFSFDLKKVKPTSWRVQAAAASDCVAWLRYDKLLDFVRWMCEGYTRHDLWPPSYMPFVPYVPLSELKS